MQTSTSFKRRLRQTANELRQNIRYENRTDSCQRKPSTVSSLASKSQYDQYDQIIYHANINGLPRPSLHVVATRDVLTYYHDHRY